MSCVFEKLERWQNLPNRTNQPIGKKDKKITACRYTNRDPNKKEVGLIFVFNGSELWTLFKYSRSQLNNQNPIDPVDVLLQAYPMVPLSCRSNLAGRYIFKGSMKRDFRLQVFFKNQCPPGLSVSNWDRFEFFRKFAEIIANECLSAVSTTPAKKDKNFEIKFQKIFC